MLVFPALGLPKVFSLFVLKTQLTVLRAHVCSGLKCFVQQQEQFPLQGCCCGCVSHPRINGTSVKWQILRQEREPKPLTATCHPENEPWLEVLIKPAHPQGRGEGSPGSCPCVCVCARAQGCVKGSSIPNVSIRQLFPPY